MDTTQAIWDQIRVFLLALLWRAWIRLVKGGSTALYKDRKDIESEKNMTNMGIMEKSDFSFRKDLISWTDLGLLDSHWTDPGFLDSHQTGTNLRFFWYLAHFELKTYAVTTCLNDSGWFCVEKFKKVYENIHKSLFA